MISNFNSDIHNKNKSDSINLIDLEEAIPIEVMSFVLDDLLTYCNCPSAFVDFKDRFLFSNGWEENWNPDLRFSEKKGILFSEIQALTNYSESGYWEIEYRNSYRLLLVPIFVRDVIAAFVILGQFVLETDSIVPEIRIFNEVCEKENKRSDLVQIISKSKFEANIQRCLHLSSTFSEQLDIKVKLLTGIRKNKETETELRIQKTFFENLFDHSPEAIIILDNEDRVIQANQEFLNLFEYDYEEVKAKKINDLIVPGNYKDEGVSATKNASVGNLIDMTTIRQTKTGKQIHVQVLGKPIVLDDNQIAVYAIYRNLTQQVWNQKSQQVVYGISEILNSSKNTIEIIKNIEKELEQIVGVGKLFFELITPNRRSLRFFDEKLDDFKEISFSESLSYSVIKEKRMLYFDENQILETIREKKLSLAHIPKKWLGFPLISDGKILGVYGVSFDSASEELNSESIELLKVISVQLSAGITKKVKDQELKVMQQSMVQSPASIVITDCKGDIEYVNPTFCEISMYTREEVIGKNPRFLKSGSTSIKTYDDMWSALLSGKEWVGELLNVKKNNELHWERAYMSSIVDEYGKITHFVAVKEDITEDKKHEKDLLEAKNRAEESDRLKSAFLANMSHELRTPLNAVIGFSNLCDESLSINEILEFVRLIHKSGNQLLGIIEDILNFTSIESESFQVSNEEFFMSNFLEDVKKMSKERQIQENKERLELQFKIDSNFSEILVKSDYQRLLQVVTNLMKNALKFTTEGFVEFGFSVNGEELCLYVKDSGVGIEKGKKDVIFERFRQADDSITRTFGGTGLGLAISKKMMDMLGGSIEVESESNVGSVFRLKLNCVISKTEKRKDRIEANSAQTSTADLILVVEDEISNFKLIQAMLKRNNYQVIRAENGEEAVQMCKDNSEISLVLMDIRMPVLDGLLATKQIRNFKPDLPIIAQTAYVMDGDRDKAIAEGCNDYISKPIKKDILLSKLKALL